MEQNEKELLEKFLSGSCTESEEREVSELLERPDAKEFLHEKMMAHAIKVEQLKAEPNDLLNKKADALKQQMQERIAQSKKQSGNNSILDFRNMLRYAAVFFGTVFLAGASWLFINRLTEKDRQLVQQEQPVLPGSDKALLTLADGSTISLSEAENGEIAAQEGLRVEKTADGEIVYRADDNTKAVANAYNSIVTPNGGQYRVTLPDGSTAWLNAASSLTYPVRFSERERRVKMTGEVYFEVAKVTDDRKERVPFFVETEKQVIQVLGTKFNVNAYTDEPYLRTALVEGSVRVTSNRNGQSVLLYPGQQSLLSDILSVKPADLDQQLSWKQGDFVFKGESLATVLRQVSRWYDVEIDCPPHLEKLRFAGIISRSKPLASLIKIMESTNDVNIKLVERRLIVTD